MPHRIGDGRETDWASSPTQLGLCRFDESRWHLQLCQKSLEPFLYRVNFETIQLPPVPMIDQSKVDDLQSMIDYMSQRGQAMKRDEIERVLSQPIPSASVDL